MSPNLVIIQLLHTSSNHDEFLRLYWAKLTSEQKRDIFYFLYNARQHKTFLTLLRYELNNGAQFIPWTHLFSILINVKKLHTDNVEPLLGLSEAADQYGRFRLNIPLLNELWETHKHNIRKEYLEKKEELLGNLKFARQQGLRGQRVKVLTQLQALYPDDQLIHSAFEEEKEFIARQTLAKANSKKEMSFGYWKTTNNDISPKDKKILLKTAKKFAKQSPALTLDIAIALYQLELFSESLAVFELIKKKNSATLWYELIVCIEANQLARALSIIDQLKTRADLSADHAFSLLYYQALCVHGLGKPAEAIHLLKQIIKIRPHFKSASSLLLEWEGDQ